MGRQNGSRSATVARSSNRRSAQATPNAAICSRSSAASPRRGASGAGRSDGANVQSIRMPARRPKIPSATRRRPAISSRSTMKWALTGKKEYRTHGSRARPSRRHRAAGAGDAEVQPVLCQRRGISRRLQFRRRQLPARFSQHAAGLGLWLKIAITPARSPGRSAIAQCRQA
jgi:hypothetical protein